MLIPLKWFYAKHVGSIKGGLEKKYPKQEEFSKPFLGGITAIG